MFAAIARAQTGHYEVAGLIDSQRRFVSFRALPDFPLIVAVSDLTASSLAPFRRRAAEYRISAVIFTLFVALFCLVLIRAERSHAPRQREPDRRADGAPQGRGGAEREPGAVHGVPRPHPRRGVRPGSARADPVLQPGIQGPAGAVKRSAETPASCSPPAPAATSRPASGPRCAGAPSSWTKRWSRAAARGSSRPGCSLSTGRARSRSSGAFGRQHRSAPVRGGAARLRRRMQQPRNWRASASWRGASPTTSTTC